ncbi:hypothetical protein D6T64_17705 [Cryobacterium melibiosiphilum]|uniref:Bacterial Ig-like domain-containing protein n=1 Tax=Cryobacterium melibiosiphilum TaxID=995039 RepID=A0A3A5MIN8_9MICO|nr:Ig-like domain repeat protein [Cryobacterium melibiosiphilum]RJT86111.1 hypothetical protein D6T64_17705 [Cryobacterium melibiosiphilum]
MSSAVRSPLHRHAATLSPSSSGRNPARAGLTAVLVAALLGGYGTAAVAVGVGDEPVDLQAPASVGGSGATGSVSVPVTPGATGSVPLNVSGLTPGARLPNPDDAASPVTGSAATGDEFRYSVDIAAGSRFVRFDLDSIGDGADLDLNIFLDRPGEESVMWDSQSSASDERVDIPEAPAGSYQVVINTFEGASDFTLTTYVVPSGSGSGTFTATPSTLAGTAGSTANIGLSWASLSWADLPAGTPYLGVVEYGDTGVRTVLTVAPGAVGPGGPGGPVDPGGPTDPDDPDDPGVPPLEVATNQSPPTITGTPEVGRTLRARAGEWDPAQLDFAYRWQADGVDIPGATGVRYRVTDAAAGATITLVVTATADGFSPALAVSSGVQVLAASEVTLTLNRREASVGRTITARIRVLSGDTAQTGAVVVSVDNRDYTVQLGRGGRARFTLPDLKAGTHRVSASWAGTATVAGDESPTARLRLR